MKNDVEIRFLGKEGGKGSKGPAEFPITIILFKNKVVATICIENA